MGERAHLSRHASEEVVVRTRIGRGGTHLRPACYSPVSLPLRRYDPYAGDGDKDKGDGDDQNNAYEGMKDLFALARQQGRVVADDTRGGWKGSGKLKGGWAGGKDLGEVAPEEKGASAAALDGSTTSDWSDSDEVAHFKAPIATKKKSGDFFAPRVGGASGGPREGGAGDSRLDEGGKKRKRDKKEKKHKSEKSEKSAPLAQP